MNEGYSNQVIRMPRCPGQPPRSLREWQEDLGPHLKFEPWLNFPRQRVCLHQTMDPDATTEVVFISFPVSQS